MEDDWRSQRQREKKFLAFYCGNGIAITKIIINYFAKKIQNTITHDKNRICDLTEILRNKDMFN
ncbi:hypothetical protein T4D_7839 [Trichinella pseudospiralis]|uniref:Uncharacterized protein n=1 Tax=Trichinella pseudospiralis TaxID=6337 RepID=A0A0V1FYE9_TRIPS|nr:hypothetical protein T4D_7839 [Trichinella pseudospiralis]